MIGKTRRNFQKDPRVSTSTLWKSFGANLTSRMDLVKLDRDTNDKSEHLIHDLNNPFDKNF